LRVEVTATKGGKDLLRREAGADISSFSGEMLHCRWPGLLDLFEGAVRCWR